MTNQKLFLAQQRDLDLFLLLGQSNMSGRGPLNASTSKPHPRVLLFGNDYQWKPAVEPLDDAKNQVDVVSRDANAGVGPGMAFALDLVKNNPERQVGLVPCAKGATPLFFFLKARGTSRETLYGSTIFRAREAQKRGKLAGVLFFQGEGDANDATKRPETLGGRWGETFAGLVRDLRADLSAPDLPVVFAQLGTTTNPAYVRWAEVKASQARVRLPGVAMIKTDDLPRGDPTHFTTPAYEEIGRRFAGALSTLKGQPR